MTDELRRQIVRLERALGRKTMEVEVAGELLRGRMSRSPWKFVAAVV